MNEFNVATQSLDLKDAIPAEGREDAFARIFNAALFSGAGEETESLLPPARKANLGAKAFSYFMERPSGVRKLRIYDFDDNSPAGPVTVIEAVNDDMPFLLSSVLSDLTELTTAPRFVAHPIFRVQRNQAGQLTGLLRSEKAPPSSGRAESFLHIEIDLLTSESERKALIERLERTLDQVRVVVADWMPMVSRLREVIDSYVTLPPPVAVDELAESVQFLKWLAEGHFTFLGAREYSFSMIDETPHLEIKPGSGLGLLRNENLHVLRRMGTEGEMSPIAQEFFSTPNPLIIAKANFLSPVQRRVHVDSIGIKLYGPDGSLSGELRIVGLFSAAAYNESSKRIPFLRHKVEQVFRNLGYGPNSYSGRVLANIIESFPRDELIQISTEQLTEIAGALVRLELMPRTRVIVRLDEFGRFASVLVYVLRERFATEVRQEIIALLERAFEARMTEFTPVFALGPLVRLHVVLWKDEGQIPDVDARELEAQVEKIVRTWQDDLCDLIREHYGRGVNDILERYKAAFPPSYEYSNTPARALLDIEQIEKLTDEVPVGIDFFCETKTPTHELQVMLFQLHEPISLSRRVPVLENLGFSVISEQTFEVRTRRDDREVTIYLHELLLRTSNGEPIDINAHQARLEDCFLAIWRGDAGNDLFNKLIVEAELTWREAALMRGYSSYLRQIGAPFGEIYIAQTLAQHGDIVRDLVLLFHTMFDPARGGSSDESASQAREIAARVEAALDHVASLDEDRMMRSILNLIQSTIRTNFYQTPTELAGGATIALKIKSEKVDGLPAPKPYAEIFVTSPRFEGVHLRGGPIARGGLRWSDRPQDFRTEVLGLAKAQQVKNAIIVPQGAKGGFVPRNIAKGAGRDEIMAEGVACYRSFIANLLSLTDNLHNGAVIPPADTVRLDNDDPYLVVAADKGTATFSDIANALAVSHDFWLGDAFASGGSAGYDHKKMGITARGAWEAVKRHFREMNIDIQTTPFRVIGVGDMSGDVFGNGMLLSRKIRLLAAFDHRDIFLDPDPDPETSWEERKRLFDLPRSSWQDYNRQLISKGGGVFSRSAKSITLSPEAQSLLETKKLSASPAEIIRLLLKTEAELMWFGGIGTYVRASAETDEDVNDRANDPIRITAAEIRAKVIGEGANLGITQAARIEFAQGGGRINTDAIDNSAGVNSSDMEVNIKVALATSLRDSKLTMEERNTFLAEMTSDVAETVLRNNYLQSLAISLGEKRGLADFGFQNRLMSSLERAGLLDRGIEHLPSDVVIANRKKKGEPLTRPELAVLLAYSKIALYSELIGSSVMDDPYLSRVLAEYFPTPMRERFQNEIETHALRREIIATMLANGAINRGGSTFVIRLKEETGHDAEDIASAFAAAMGAFRLTDFFREVDELDGKIDGQRQLELYLLVQDVLRRQTAWFLRHGNFAQGLSDLIERYRAGIDSLSGAVGAIFDEWLTGRLEEAQKQLASTDFPSELARRFAMLKALTDAPDIISLAIRLGKPDLEVGQVYLRVSSYFRVDEFRSATEKRAPTDYYERLAVNSTLDSVSSAQRAIVEKIYALSDGGQPDFDAWYEKNRTYIKRVRGAIDEMLNGSELTLAKLTLAVAQLRELAEL